MNNTNNQLVNELLSNKYLIKMKTGLMKITKTQRAVLNKLKEGYVMLIFRQDNGEVVHTSLRDQWLRPTNWLISPRTIQALIDANLIRRGSDRYKLVKTKED